jgi:hypothetical protein
MPLLGTARSNKRERLSTFSMKHKQQQSELEGVEAVAVGGGSCTA